MSRIIDLFAGPGGWSEGLRTLGYSETGIEWDEAACATARAAGHERIQADVAALDPSDFAPCCGVIASAPCPTFSAAGSGAGRHLTEIIVACLRALSKGRDTRAEARAEAFETLQPVAWEAEQAKAKKTGREPDRERADARARRDADMSILVVEPLRWTLALRPEWVALEQVPEVLPLWEVMASLLQAHGYSTWTGKLEAERFGVPQTRERAMLIAHRSRAVVPPEPTHQRYVPGEPQRHEATMFGEVLPWVSMAQALGWGMTERPCVTLAAGSGRQGGADPLNGGSGARATVRSERERGAWAVHTGNFTAVERDADGERSKAGSVPYERDVADPAPVVTGNTDRWQVHPTHYDRRQGSGKGDDRRMVRAIPVTDPAPTIASDGLLKGRDVWITGQARSSGPGAERPPRSLGEPSYTLRANAGGGSEGVGRSGGIQWETESKPVRVTVEEAAILQSFRLDYPWQGSRTKQFEQVGNAVPPMLARAVLSVLIDDLMTAVRATEKAA